MIRRSNHGTKMQRTTTNWTNTSGARILDDNFGRGHSSICLGLNSYEEIQNEESI